MPLANMRDLLSQAKEKGCAVGAFSVSSLDMIGGVIAAAEEKNAPVILQVAQCRLPSSPLHLIGPAMLSAAKAACVPVAVHLDHGLTLPCIRDALEMGFTSVMIDGSSLPMEENIALTRQVMALASPFHAAVEAEIGRVGKTESGQDAPAQCASPEDAILFAKESHVDALAVAIGNAHGVYSGAPRLHFDILEEIRKYCAVPLVLHGGTGISEEDFRRCIALGMHKINIATATFQAVCHAAQGASDYFAMSGSMTRAAKEVALRHIDIFNSAVLL
ncbi:MAG: ketose-bisphosphate aldolase [Clostridia bacterium]|nr:ketose-bisphosphate aldolase [Clostridia bacterium]